MTAGNFTVEETPLEGLRVIRCRVFADDRGFLYESWREEAFAALGVAGRFVQDNHSRSRKGVLRGMHWQDRTAPQGKLIRCTRGAIYDVAVDIRAGSATFGRWHGVRLAGEDAVPALLWVPPGFAHGFLSLADATDVLYRCSGTWNREAERCLRWDDPEVAIAWPLEGPPILSEKDRAGLSLAAVRRNPSFVHGDPA